LLLDFHSFQPVERRAEHRNNERQGIMSTTSNTASIPDLEIKDAQLIFNAIWADLERELGRDNLRFPREIIWLNGAPGSGKGTQTRFLMNFRDITDGPIVISSLLTSPEAKKIIDAGGMVGDREVLNLLLRELLNPRYDNGVVVDGFPRTKVQVECVKLIYQKLNGLRAEFYPTEHRRYFPKPIFHITVLFVDEKESIKRQLMRGKKAQEHNEKVRESGVGELMEERATDFDEDTARRRYRTFKEGTYEALKNLKQIFHYHYINAHGTIQQVQERIVQEMRYQSSLELDEATYDRIRRIPIAEDIVRNARQALVKRLDDYEENSSELFEQVTAHIAEKFMPIIHRHAISGMAIINSENELFHDPMALQMLIDVFSDRGYNTTIDIRKKYKAAKVDLSTGEIEFASRRVFKFRISFTGSVIRRG